MRTEVVLLKPEYVRDIVERNLAEGITPTTRVSVDDMLHSYFSPGSASYCLMVEDIPVVAGGIINLGWKRGEAWVLASSLFYGHRKTAFKVIKQMLPGLAAAFKFRRVQAVSVNGDGKIMKHLEFGREGVLRAYGPEGQDVTMYSRIFGGPNGRA